MNILMIGHSRSGKTSYMAGLYNILGDKTDGFGLWLSDSDKRARLQHISTNLNKGIYPKETDIASEYNFWLQYNDSLIIPFNWYDYRGGALMEWSSWSKDKSRLLQKIDETDALIVFIDGEKANFDISDALEDEYDTLMWAIKKSISKKTPREGHYFPISFVFTKGDLYIDHSQIYKSQAFDYFMPLFTAIRDSKTAVGEIVVTEVTKGAIYNVYMPLMFSLGYGMHHYINQRIVDLHLARRKYENANPFSQIFNTGKAKQALQEIEREIDNLKTLEALGDYIDNQLKQWRDENYILTF